MNPKSITAETPPPHYGVTWFSMASRKEVKLVIERLKNENVSVMRLGIDCEKFNTKNGLKWYDWLVPTLAKYFELELCFSIFSQSSVGAHYGYHSYSEIVEHFILKHGQHFSLVELWRNPTNRANEEISENIFSEDVVFTATWAKYHGKKVGLGGIQAIDFEWIAKLISCKFLQTIEYLKIDKESRDSWSTNAMFYERKLQSLLSAKGVKIEIRTSETPIRDLQTSCGEIAC